MTRPDALPLAQRYRVNPITGCWIFLGSRDADGYGRVGSVVAHRVFYEAFVGPIPDGLQLDHLCVRTNCVNPSHLEPVTGAENLARASLYRPLVRAERTACANGHVYTEATAFRSQRVFPDGKEYTTWICRVCRRANKARARARARALKTAS